MLAFGAEEEGAVGGVVHEEIFHRDCRSQGVAEDVEVFLEVGVGVGVVGSDAVAGDVDLGGVAVDGDEEDVVFAQLAAPLVHAAAALGGPLGEDRPPTCVHGVFQARTDVHLLCYTDPSIIHEAYPRHRIRVIPRHSRPPFPVRL